MVTKDVSVKISPYLIFTSNGDLVSFAPPSPRLFCWGGGGGVLGGGGGVHIIMLSVEWYDRQSTTFVKIFVCTRYAVPQIFTFEIQDKLNAVFSDRIPDFKVLF